jgi:hypothetical protein
VDLGHGKNSDEVWFTDDPGVIGGWGRGWTTNGQNDPNARPDTPPVVVAPCPRKALTCGDALAAGPGGNQPNG